MAGKEDVKILLTSINNSLKQTVEQNRELYPQPGDEEAYVGAVQAVPGSSVVTITWTFRDDYKYYIKKIYVDPGLNCTFAWEFSHALAYLEGKIEIDGNEHEFTKPFVATEKSTLKLEITNTGAATDLDIIIDAWGRRIKE
ncbi:MAG: hypothetical protein M8353_03260 [ANME-2 cluster archaeon]|nr:hypothetical protein [ANME-2 cluster archaeon]